jgi:hypothetical protein
MTEKKGHVVLRKTTLALGLLAALALPAAATAQPPSKADKRHAAKDCKEEREASRDAFKEQYGTNANKRNAFGKCVSIKARQRKAERKAARSNAARECRAEREEIGADAFREQYGTNRNKRNAFGKCVSSKAKDDLAGEEETPGKDEEEETAPKNAAQTCAAERDAMGEEAFAETYGTNGNKRNAFGKCVSSKASGSPRA